MSYFYLRLDLKGMGDVEVIYNSNLEKGVMIWYGEEEFTKGTIPFIGIEGNESFITLLRLDQGFSPNQLINIKLRKTIFESLDGLVVNGSLSSEKEVSLAETFRQMYLLNTDKKAA